MKGQGPGVHSNHVAVVCQWLPVFIRNKPHPGLAEMPNPGQESDPSSICCFIVVSRARVISFKFNSFFIIILLKEEPFLKCDFIFYLLWKFLKIENIQRLAWVIKG